MNALARCLGRPRTKLNSRADVEDGGLQAAVDADLLPRNPADKADPPTAKQAKAPEMYAWRADELRTFLDWAQGHGDRTAWLTLPHAGMRRGELLAALARRRPGRRHCERAALGRRGAGEGPGGADHRRWHED